MYNKNQRIRKNFESKTLSMRIFFIILLILSGNTSYSQEFRNLNFDQVCDTSKTGLCYWKLSFGTKGSVSPIIDDGEKCMLLHGMKANSVTWAEQSSSVDFSKGMAIVTITAFIRTDSVEGKGAGFNVNLYDRDGNYMAFKDMGGRYSLDWIRGTTKWKEYSMSIVCPTETGSIHIGAILYGKGKACIKDYKVSVSEIMQRKPSKLAIKFINAACDTIFTHSLWRDSLNIKKIKTEALRIAGAAKKYTDCYNAIQYLIGRLSIYGDHHSFFMKADEYTSWKSTGSLISIVKFPEHKIIDSCGYISVPGFHSGNQKQILAFADSLQSDLNELSQKNIKGWIIDLRENDGGNQEPMIAGLGPLFSSEKLGSLVDLDRKASSWYYNKKGKYFGDGYVGWNVTKPIILTHKLPIAVLTGNTTGSSGEIVAISFKNNEYTRSFGQPTGGYTTGTINYELIDGSQIFLASTRMADRNGKIYHGSVHPDEEINNSNKEMDVIAAIKWIKQFR